MSASIPPIFLEIDRQLYRRRLNAMSDSALSDEAERRTLIAFNEPDPSGDHWRWNDCLRACRQRGGGLFEDGVRRAVQGGMA